MCFGTASDLCNIIAQCASDTDVGGADSKVVYRRYASLFFVTGIGSDDNELVTLEIIHRYVEVLDRYFGNVSAKSLSCEHWTLMHAACCLIGV